MNIIVRKMLDSHTEVHKRYLATENVGTVNTRTLFRLFCIDLVYSTYDITKN